MKTARAIVITGRRTAETAVGHRLRLRDAGLYQLPVVVDHYGGSAQLTARYGIGAVTDPTDLHDLATALIDAVRDGPARSGYLTALHHQRGRFELENHVEGLLSFLTRGGRAPDVGSPGHTRAINNLITSHPDVRERPPLIR